MAEQKSKNSVLTEDKTFRQSFDRFDDKLVENILSFLTFREKVLFESVSKQWKKCIYNQQKGFSLSSRGYPHNDLLNRLLIPTEVVDWITGYITRLAGDFKLKSVNKVWLKS